MLQLGLAALAGLALCLSGLPLWLKLAGVLLVLCWMLYLMLYGGYRALHAVSAIACQQGQWRLWRQQPAAVVELAVELTGEQVVLPWLVVLQWRAVHSAERGALALWPDSAAPEDLRRLRVWLRFGMDRGRD